MKYNRVYMESLDYELPPVVVTSDELEERLAPMYESLHMVPGQLAALTGISERRWWEQGYPLSEGAATAARKTLAKSNVDASDIEALIYTGVSRENFEPATACAVAHALNISPDAYVYGRTPRFRRADGHRSRRGHAGERRRDQYGNFRRRE